MSGSFFEQYGDISGAHLANRRALNGRGAKSNHVGRFEREIRHAIDDGWHIGPCVMHEHEEPPLPPLRTEIREEKARKLINRNTSPDLPFEFSINPYRGCEHGCSYCFARPTHSYMGLSAGLDFETRLFAKPDAARLLDAELRHPKYQPQTIAIGTNTDPYQPIEKDRRIMREILQVLHDHRHPVWITTKSALVTRDIDLLAPMAKAGLAHISISLTTLDHKVSRKMEPRAASPTARLRTMQALSKAGIPVHVMIAPVVPALTDHEIEKLLEAARASGATHATYIMLRLPLEVSGIFQEWLAAEFPDRAKRVMDRVRELQGGKDYDPTFGKRMNGQGVWAALTRRRFMTTRDRLGYRSSGPKLRTDLFRADLPSDAQQRLPGF